MVSSKEQTWNEKVKRRGTRKARVGAARVSLVTLFTLFTSSPHNHTVQFLRLHLHQFPQILHFLFDLVQYFLICSLPFSVLGRLSVGSIFDRQLDLSLPSQPPLPEQPDQRPSCAKTSFLSSRGFLPVSCPPCLCHSLLLQRKLFGKSISPR